MAGYFFQSTSYFPLSRLCRWTSGRRLSLACTTNHSGNWNAGTPVAFIRSSSETTGGPFRGTGLP